MLRRRWRMGWERQHRSPIWARLRKVLRQTKTKKTKAPRLPGSEGQVRLHITLASMPVLLSTEEQVRDVVEWHDR